MGGRNRDHIHKEMQIEMNSDNRALFIFGFVFYFLGDLATTCIGISNGIPEKGLIRVIGSPDLTDMVVMKVVFFVVLCFLIVFFKKRGEDYLCEVAGMGMAVTWMNALAVMEGMGWGVICKAS
jgi:hypothetical protein